MLDQMERNNVQVGRGAPIGNDGSIWLDGHTFLAADATEVSSLIQFGKRRLLLAMHHYVFCNNGPINDDA